MRVHAYQGMYFQGWSSEDLTQTLPLQDLRDAPLQSLLNMHIEPPRLMPSGHSLWRSLPIWNCTTPYEKSIRAS